MEMESLDQDAQESMEKRMVALSEDFKKIRTGKANVSMLDSIKINYYGTPTALNQAANITCPDARSFVITPWEASILKEIEMAIVKSDLGMSPINDGKIIRLRVPELTEERRKDLVKAVKKAAEDARISIRKVRKESNDFIKTALKDKTISEDDSKASMDKIQTLTDSFIKKVDQVMAEKEKDLMTI